jgi:hypothetical protein
MVGAITGLRDLFAAEEPLDVIAGRVATTVVAAIPHADVVSITVLSWPDASIILRATGHPDGPRSLTWSVLGAKNSDNVYVGTWGMMDAAKLSLHESGVWRSHSRRRAEKEQLPEGADRLIERYAATNYLAPGWAHAARIRTPLRQRSERRSPSPARRTNSRYGSTKHLICQSISCTTWSWAIAMPSPQSPPTWSRWAR